MKKYYYEDPTFKLWEGPEVPGPGVLVPLLHHAQYKVSVLI